MFWMFHGPGVMVTPLVPSVGPDAAAPEGGDAVAERGIRPAAGRCSGRARRCRRRSGSGARRRSRRWPVRSPGPGSPRPWCWGCRPCRSPTILPSLIPTSALTTPSSASTIVTLVITRSSTPLGAGEPGCRLPMPSRRVLPPPYIDLVAEDPQVLLDLDVEVGVAQPDLVARGRAVQFRRTPAVRSDSCVLAPALARRDCRATCALPHLSWPLPCPCALVLVLRALVLKPRVWAWWSASARSGRYRGSARRRSSRRPGR